MAVPAGDALPAGDPHGVSVSLPAWADTVAWAQRDPVFLSKLKTGYPRFFIPHVVRHLSQLVLKHAEALCLLPRTVQGDRIGGELRASCDSSLYSALLLGSFEATSLFLSYLSRCGIINTQRLGVSFNSGLRIIDGNYPKHNVTTQNLCIYTVIFPIEAVARGESFWQHTGSGISSRCAEYWLEHGPLRGPNWSRVSTLPSLHLRDADEAKELLRGRIARLSTSPSTSIDSVDVFLYPTGMSAIDTTATVLESVYALCGSKKACRVAVFGFLYVDTFKVLSDIHGFDCVLYGHASPSDLDRLESDLKSGMVIQALYTEFPGNPLMISPDIEKLRELSLRYNFLLLVDETIGTSVNVSLAPHCDIACMSLTKMFSGGCNVMGGSVILNPSSSWYERLRNQFMAIPSCSYFPQDVLIMERNSRDFQARVSKASSNAEYITAILRKHSSVSTVYYPKGSPSQPMYDHVRREGKGYGFLISVKFVTEAGAVAFHDAFNVSKGPSLGTNFTLCCAYTLLAHYQELDWAAQFGVTEHLVRISVGIEDKDILESAINIALSAIV